MRDIKANGEVRALIGAEKLRELHGDAPAERRAVRIPSARRSLVARGG